jgi:L-malate glycosyltransferase
MNALQLIGSFHQGGSERQAVQLTKLLKQDGTVNVFIASLNNDGLLRKEVETIGFTEIDEFKLTSFYDLNFFKQLRNCVKFLKKNKIDVIHTHDFYTNIFGMFAGTIAGVKIRIASKRETGGVRSKKQESIEKIAFSRASKIVANSQAVKKYLIADGISDKKINVIYNGLNLERLKPKQTNRQEICGNLKLPNAGNLKFITIVANLRHDVKNIPMFLRVAKKVCGEFNDVRFVVAGEGELLSDLQNLAAKLQVTDKLSFIGSCSEVPELLSVSFAGVLTSFNEGFSNSILEYMAAGKPVVATNVGGASEAIIESETGYLVESDDDQTMANRLIELLNNEQKAEKLGETGRQIVIEKFSLKSQLEKTLELYKS